MFYRGLVSMKKLLLMKRSFVKIFWGGKMRLMLVKELEFFFGILEEFS